MSQAFVGFAPQKREYNWPPNDYQRRNNANNHQSEQERYRSMLELDEVMVIPPHGTVQCFRPPPWTQYYRTPYQQS